MYTSITFIPGSYPTYEEWKHSEKSSYFSWRILCSYPTYEEWKLCSLCESFNEANSSYPTYEEWKHNNEKNGVSNTLSSYPTYEEWKQLSENYKEFKNWVLILPMRNGNMVILIREATPKSFVLILPMRNGNFKICYPSFQLVFKFLSYLWGMETYKNI